MSVLRPDPAEYIEDFGCGPIRPIDVLCGALAFAECHGISLSEVASAALRAESVRDFDRQVEAMIEQRRQAA